MNAEDALRYAAAILRERIAWTTDEIGGSCCNGDHELQLDAIHQISKDIANLAARFGDPNLYSDGRVVESGRWIDENAIYTSHVWHPNPDEDATHTWRGHLPSDPDEPSAGVYEGECEPATQQIRVRVVRMVR